VLNTARVEGEMKGEIKGIIKGEIKGKIKGKIEGIYETAKNGIIAGFSNEIIKAMTKLTDEQIDKIREELKNNY
jgi:predicted transposase/invertase (TIGR01784 family)